MKLRSWRMSIRQDDSGTILPQSRGIVAFRKRLNPKPKIVENRKSAQHRQGSGSGLLEIASLSAKKVVSRAHTVQSIMGWQYCHGRSKIKLDCRRLGRVRKRVGDLCALLVSNTAYGNGNHVLSVRGRLFRPLYLIL